jgi:tetratricopeptide (TPR) repeat protein
MFNLGEEYLRNGNIEEAMKYHQECLDLRSKKNDKIEDTRNQIKSMISLGLIFKYKGDLKNSKDILEKAENLTRNQIGEKNEFIADIWYHIGEVFQQYKNKENKEKAYDYHKKSLEVKLSIEEIGKDHYSTAASYLQLGIIKRSLLKL